MRSMISAAALTKKIARVTESVFRVVVSVEYFVSSSPRGDNFMTRDERTLSIDLYTVVRGPSNQIMMKIRTDETLPMFPAHFSARS